MNELNNLLDKYINLSNKIIDNEYDFNTFNSLFDERDKILLLINKNIEKFKDNELIKLKFEQAQVLNDKIVYIIKNEMDFIKKELERVDNEKLDLNKNKFLFRDYVKTISDDNTNYYIDKKS